MSALDPYEVISVDAEEEPNQTGTITSIDYVMVKYLHDDDLDDKLGNDYEDYNIAMGMGGCFPHSNKIREEYYNVGHGNVDTYEYQNGDIHIQTND